jgi:hypothetical protein
MKSNKGSIRRLDFSSARSKRMTSRRSTGQASPLLPTRDLRGRRACGVRTFYEKAAGKRWDPLWLPNGKSSAAGRPRRSGGAQVYLRHLGSDRASEAGLSKQPRGGDGRARPLERGVRPHGYSRRTACG